MAILRQHHLEKKHFISCAHAEATQVSDETWVCMMPELKPEAPEPRSSEIATRAFGIGFKLSAETGLHSFSLSFFVVVFSLFSFS